MTVMLFAINIDFNVVKAVVQDHCDTGASFCSGLVAVFYDECLHGKALKHHNKSLH